MKKKKRNFSSEINLLGGVWLAAWFGAIWLEPIRWQLLVTGAFCFMLVIALVQPDDE